MMTPLRFESLVQAPRHLYVMHKKRTLLSFALIVSFNPFAIAQNSCEAGTAGDTMQWAIALCEVRAETDDFESPCVQACLKRLISRDHIKNQPYVNCKLNLRYKTEWCGNVVRLGAESTVAACVGSRQAIPRNVHQGHVGE
jgi:hypothetical protein